MGSSLRLYLDCIKNTLEAAMCLQNFPCQEVNFERDAETELMHLYYKSSIWLWHSKSATNAAEELILRSDTCHAMVGQNNFNQYLWFTTLLPSIGFGRNRSTRNRRHVAVAKGSNG